MLRVASFCATTALALIVTVAGIVYPVWYLVWMALSLGLAAACFALVPASARKSVSTYMTAYDAVHYIAHESLFGRKLHAQMKLERDPSGMQYWVRKMPLLEAWGEFADQAKREGTPVKVFGSWEGRETPRAIDHTFWMANQLHIDCALDSNIHSKTDVRPRYLGGGQFMDLQIDREGVLRAWPRPNVAQWLWYRVAEWWSDYRAKHERFERILPLSPEATSNRMSSSPLALSLGAGGDFEMRTASFYTYEHTINFRIANDGGDRALTNCRVWLELTSPDDGTPRRFQLKTETDLNPGDEFYIPLLKFQEPKPPSGQEMCPKEIDVLLPPSRVGMHAWPFKLPLKSVEFRLIATSAETREVALRCRSWIDGEWKLRIEKN